MSKNRVKELKEEKQKYFSYDDFKKDDFFFSSQNTDARKEKKVISNIIIHLGNAGKNHK